MNVLHLEENLSARILLVLSAKKSQFAIHASKLEALNPLSILSRGYLVAYKDQGKKMIKKSDDVELDSEISLKLSDGYVDAKVTNIRKA